MKTKLHPLLPAIVIIVGFLIACNKKADIVSDEDTLDITLAYYNKTVRPANAGPILMTEMDGDVVAMYYSPIMSDCNIFYYQEPGTNEQMLMMVSDESIILAPLNSEDNPVKIAAFTWEEGFDTLLLGEYDLQTGRTIITGSATIGLETVPTTKAPYHFGDDFRRSLKEGLLDKIRTEGSDLGAAVNAVFPPAGSMISAICKSISLVGMQVLQQDAGSVLGDEISATIETTSMDHIFYSPLADYTYNAVGEAILRTGRFKKLKVKLMPYSTVEAISRQVYRFSEKAALGMFPTDESAISQGSASLSSRVLTQSGCYYAGVTNGVTMPDDSRNPFIISFKVLEVGQKTATFSGSSSATSEYGHASDVVIEQGFVYRMERGGSETYVRSEGLGNKSVTLSPATSYIAAAYVRTLSGKEWYSKSVRFITKGTLIEFSPVSAFSFSMEGGEKSTNVIVGDGASWTVLSAPSWCTVHYSNTTLRVIAEKTNKDRSGEIVVETTSAYGERQTATIQVSQFARLVWDGTVWHFIATDKQGESYEFDLIVNNVAGGQFSISYESEEDDKSIWLDENGNLVVRLYFYGIYQGGGNGIINNFYVWEWREGIYTFIRLDPDFATGTVERKGGGGIGANPPSNIEEQFDHFYELKGTIMN